MASREPEEGAAGAAIAWRASLPSEFRRRSDLHGTTIFGISAVLYVVTFIAMFLLPALWMQLLALSANTILIGALFVIGHDACHGSLVKRGWLNRYLGRLAMLPAWHPYTAWSHAHNTLHHGGTNLKGRHPDFVPYSKAEFDALPLWRQWVQRLYRTPLGVGVYYVFDFYCNYMLFPHGPRRSPYRLAFNLDRLLVGAFLIVQLGAAWGLASLREEPILPPLALAAITVFASWALWIWFMGFVTFIQHTHPSMAWYDKVDEWSFYQVQLKSTAHVVFPWVIERALHNIMDHPAHHIDPTIPLYSLPQSQRLLEDHAGEHAIRIKWSLREYLRICATCKLYDFDNHCWLNFKGEPTTPPGLAGSPFQEKRVLVGDIQQ